MTINGNDQKVRQLTADVAAGKLWLMTGEMDDEDDDDGLCGAVMTAEPHLIGLGGPSGEWP